MKYAHSVKLTVFSYEHENLDSISESFLKLFPFNLEQNKVILKKTQATGFNEKKIKILEATLTKNSLINDFLKNTLDKLDESQKNQVLGQIESRLDKNLDFFLRFDKNEWIDGKKLILTDGGKCFHIRISIAAFPKKKEIALNIMRNLFSQK